MMLIDLTAIYGPGNEPSTAAEFEADALAWGHDMSQYQAYDAGTPMGGSASFTGLRGIGSTALDTQELVGGERTRKTGTLHLDGTEDWSTHRSAGTHDQRGFVVANYFPSAMSRAAYINACWALISIPTGGSSYNGVQLWCGGNNNRNLYLVWYSTDYTLPAELSSWYDAENDTLDVQAFKTWLTSNPIDVAYALPTAATESATPQPLTTVAGLNAFYESAPTITGTPLSLRYTGTDYSIATISGQKYLSRVNGVESVVNGGSPIAVRGGRDRLINLTRWCGAGLEPSTTDGFYALYPWMRGYDMPAMQGTLRGYEGTGIETVGFNAYDPSTGQALVLGGHQYQITGTYTALAYSDGTAITPDASGFFTPTVNDLLTVTGGNDSDTCIHLTWTHYRDGDYEPYWSQVRSLPIAQHFPDGMQGNGTTWDSLYTDKSVQRWGTFRVTSQDDIATYAPSTGTSRGFQIENKLPYNFRRTANMSIFGNLSEGSGWSNNSAFGCVWCGAASEGGNKNVYIGFSMGYPAEAWWTRMGFYDPGTDTLDVTAFKAWLDTVDFRVAYCLVNPNNNADYTITTPIEPPIPMTYKVADFGVEQSLPANGRTELLTAPFRGIVAYSTNFVRELATLPRNYMSMDSFNEMAASLQQFADISVTPTWDAANGKYTFAFAHVANVTQLGTFGATLQPGKTYAATTSSGAQYVLPAITTANLSLDIVVQLAIGSTQPADLFVDGSATAIPIVGAPSFSQGETWLMVCSWIPALSKWIVLPINTQE